MVPAYLVYLSKHHVLKVVKHTHKLRQVNLSLPGDSTVMARSRSTETRIRDAHALELRRQGLTYDQIAQVIAHEMAEESAVTGEQPRGYTGVAAHHAVKRALRDSYREQVNDATQLELERLDELIRQTIKILGARHYAFSAATGRIATMPDGSLMQDYGPKLQAIQVLKGLSESRRKLLGLDAPQRRVVEIITEDMVDGMIAAAQEDIKLRRAEQLKAIEAGVVEGEVVEAVIEDQDEER
jgi:hypothetical protein